MKALVLLVNDSLLGRKILFRYHSNDLDKTQSNQDNSTFKLTENFTLDKFLQSNSKKFDPTINCNTTKLFGIEKEFFLDLFMPKDSNF